MLKTFKLWGFYCKIAKRERKYFATQMPQLATIRTKKNSKTFTRIGKSLEKGFSEIQFSRIFGNVFFRHKPKFSINSRIFEFFKNVKFFLFEVNKSTNLVLTSWSKIE